MGEDKWSDVCSFIHYVLRPTQSVGMSWEQPGQALLSGGYVLQGSGTLGSEAIIPGSQGKPEGPSLPPSPSLLCKGISRRDLYQPFPGLEGGRIPREARDPAASIPAVTLCPALGPPPSFCPYKVATSQPFTFRKF